MRLRPRMLQNRRTSEISCAKASHGPMVQVEMTAVAMTVGMLTYHFDEVDVAC